MQEFQGQATTSLAFYNPLFQVHTYETFYDDIFKFMFYTVGVYFIL